MDSKGIFNMEMFISLFVLLIIFAMLIGITADEFSSIEETQNRKESRILASDIAEILNKVYMGGNGYSQTCQLPELINQESYILQINKSGVYINSHYQITYSKSIPHMNINKQKYILEPGNRYEFINNNNTIEITQYP